MRSAGLLTALAASAMCVAAALALVPVRGDLAELLPHAGTEATRLMMDELRHGAGASIVLVGIEDAPVAELARISLAVGAKLSNDPDFALVENGHAAFGETEITALFARRYALSPAVTPEAFTASALRAAFGHVLDGLRSSASPVVTRYLLPDPTGAFPAVVAAWTGASRVRTINGVWFAADRPRALMLLKPRQGGLDLGSGQRAIAAVEHAFTQAAGHGGARLLLAGPAVFTRDAALAIRRDVRLVASLSSILVAALLAWRFRSAVVLAAIAIPLMLGVAAGALVTAAVFGFVHGITLGFGMTMLGVTVDYPVLLIGHRKPDEQVTATWARIGPTFAMAVLAATLGLSGMVFAGVPALAQLGVFAVTGVLTAAAATRLVLPRLIVTARIAPAFAGDPALLRRVERWRRWRALGLVPVAGAAILLAVGGAPSLERDLSSLTPLPAGALALDAQLRGDLGAPEPGQLALVQGATAEAVLRIEESLTPALDRLVAGGAMSGAEYAARLLPSIATQQARAAALPDAATLAARIAEASAGLGFSTGAFHAFADDVEAARHAAPAAPGSVNNTLLRTRLDAVLFARQGSWFGVVAPLGIRDPAAVAAALSGVAGVTYIDMARESAALVADTTAGAWRPLLGGGVALVAALAATLRDPVRLARVLGSVAAALLVTLAALALARVRLSLIHVVSLQFVAGVGLDYALFFARAQVDEDERARTLRTLVTCATMALLTFGLLMFCRTPLLRGLGVTVAIGVVACIASAFLFAGPRPRHKA